MTVSLDQQQAEALAAHCAEHDLTMDDVIEAFGWLTTAFGDMSGCPRPLHDHHIVMADGHRRSADWDRGTLGPSEPTETSCGSGIRENETLRNEWWAATRRTQVYMIWRGRPRHQVWRRADGAWRRVTMPASEDFEVLGVYYRWGGFVDPLLRWRLQLDTMHAGGDAWTVKAEERALGVLRDLVTERQFRTYFTTGAFIETSKRSRARYVFRKCRPTVVLLPSGPDPDEGLRPTCTLCLHPLAYYQDTFAGGMTPTDDVVAHLMLMRADEHRFWRMANQHPIDDMRSGI